eukprot:NODE_10_length_61504_cov_0.956502.p25 type:complete len:274 gc:universal NODE_10_length_61504_cov_0.956502:19916-20737(+)
MKSLKLDLIDCRDGPPESVRSICYENILIYCGNNLIVYDHEFVELQTIYKKFNFVCPYINCDMFFTCNSNFEIWDTQVLESVYDIKNNIHICHSVDENLSLVGMNNICGLVDLRIGSILNTISSKADISSLYSTCNNDLYFGDVGGNVNWVDRRFIKPQTRTIIGPVSTIYKQEHLITVGRYLRIWGDDHNLDFELNNSVPNSRNIYNCVGTIKEYLDYLIIPTLDGDLFLYKDCQVEKFDGHYSQITSMEIVDGLHTCSVDGIKGHFQWKFK